VNERNERLLREFIAAFEFGDVDSMRTIVDPNIVDHTLPPGATPGIEGLLYAVNAYREGFPNLRSRLTRSFLMVTASSATD
jgi:hypothetical protein